MSLLTFAKHSRNAYFHLVPGADRIRVEKWDIARDGKNIGCIWKLQNRVYHSTPELYNIYFDTLLNIGGRVKSAGYAYSLNGAKRVATNRIKWLLYEVNKSPPVRIVAAAIFRNGVIFSLSAPNRHHNVLHAMYDIGIKKEGLSYQGFVTSEGKFVFRVDAGKIARAAGQLKPNARLKASGLYSEDLW